MKTKDLYNIHKNKRCFILANGPSINSLDLSFLKNEITIGINASTLLEKKHNFIQTYYTVSDTRFFEVSFKKELATTKLHSSTIKVFRQEIRNILDEVDDKTVFIPALERDGFSFNLCRGYCYGNTTVMLALQLAYYLGCNQIYLLGLDLTYTEHSPRFYKEDILQIDDSRTSVQIFNIANAALQLQERDVQVFNCNPDSLVRNYLRYANFNELFV